MDPLPSHDQHCLRAAEGWLDLGNSSEALHELDQVSATSSSHPDALNLRWQIHRHAKDWEKCFTVARAFTEAAPADPRAWTSLAQTFYHTGRIQEAYDLAVSKITSFPRYWPLYYDAACYACLTGRLPQARQFLQMATVWGDEADVKRLAAEDPDLQALRAAKE